MSFKSWYMPSVNYYKDLLFKKQEEYFFIQIKSTPKTRGISADITIII